MLSMTRSLIAAQRGASRRVAEAKKFSIRLPGVGEVAVPAPDQLAFYAVLGGLAAVELIDWPLAIAMGIGSAVIARHIDANEVAADEPAPPPPARTAPAKKAAAKKAPARKAPAKKATATKAPARKST